MWKSLRRADKNVIRSWPTDGICGRTDGHSALRFLMNTMAAMAMSAATRPITSGRSDPPDLRNIRSNPDLQIVLKSLQCSDSMGFLRSGLPADDADAHSSRPTQDKFAYFIFLNIHIISMKKYDYSFIENLPLPSSIFRSMHRILSMNDKLEQSLKHQAADAMQTHKWQMGQTSFDGHKVARSG